MVDPIRMTLMGIGLPALIQYSNGGTTLKNEATLSDLPLAKMLLLHFKIYDYYPFKILLNHLEYIGGYVWKEAVSILKELGSTLWHDGRLIAKSQFIN